MTSQVSKKDFGKLSDGTVVSIYKLSNSAGMTVELLDYGATIKSINVPDKDGNIKDVALGFDDLPGYLGYLIKTKLYWTLKRSKLFSQNPYFGCIVGRVANRIAKGEFQVDGETFKVAQNNGENALHGGLKVMFYSATILLRAPKSTLIF